MADPSIFAYLEIRDFACPPDEITVRLGIVPSLSWSEGDHIPNPARPNPTSGWRLQSPLPDRHDLEVHALWLLDRAPPRIDLAGLTSRWSVGLSFAVYVSGRTPAMFFQNATLARIVALGATLDIDLYVLPPDDAGEAA